MESREDHSIFETIEDGRDPRMLLTIVQTMEGFAKFQVTNGIEGRISIPLRYVGRCGLAILAFLHLLM